ncbi:hypothetical protein A5893_04325 [Pedobacter psychrophilus]|uniref:DUF1456 domain-containing protein n=1 Tax=Pedobacter psychrophilus TaxID=1826909 RepID=A0A179DP92_9SPHI|nr:DUF1456 family protein [Pedobacter psychrophilus]OAQ42343.1 hypothetical protein A5893_04325 [Pedobacter psychrophilus]
MTNNDIIRRLRYTFNYSDDKMIAIFAAADQDFSRAEISNWLKKDDDPEYKSLHDINFAIFLNGLINLNRGKKEGEQPKPEKNLNNNIIFKKLKIALSLKDDDILEILDLVNFRLTKTELSAFFRNPEQNQYRPCKDQILRNFIHGLQLKYHPENPE